MSKKKKIWLTVLLGLLIAFSLYTLVRGIIVISRDINYIKADYDIYIAVYNSSEYLDNLLLMKTTDLIALTLSNISAIVLETFLIIKVWSINHLIKMSYEEYKEKYKGKRKEKQKLKLIKKQENLQKQLEDINKN